MKLYTVLIGDQYYPSGNGDIVGYFYDKEEAIERADKYNTKFGWRTVIETDLETLAFKVIHGEDMS